MKKYFVVAIMIIATTRLMNAQAIVDWYNYPGGVSIATDASNNVYTANWDYNPAGDITLTKRNSTGTILWNVAYDNIDNTRHEVATWVDTDNAGNILVSGTIRSGYSNPVNAASLLMKYDAAGNLLWRVVYENSFDGSSTTKCLVDANNNIYVLGLGTGPNGQVTKVKKFNSSGVSVWNYFDSEIGAPLNFKFTPDNKIVISHRGLTGSINGYSKIDLNGNNIWSLSGINSLTAGDAAGDAFGNTYIINGEYVVVNAGSILTKLSPAGAVLWSQTNTMKGNRIEIGTDNFPVISGYPSVGYGAAFMKYDNNGNFIWQNLDADGAALALLAHAQLKLDGNNAAYLIGSTMSQMGVCKVNNDGTSAWTVTTPSGYPVCFDFGTDNNIYVAGGTTARITQPSNTCDVPTNITSSNITATKATITWTGNNGAVKYRIHYRALGTTAWTTKIVTAPVITKTLTLLQPITTYEYCVRSDCNTSGTIASAYSSIQTFTTICDCAKPTIINVTAITQTSASVNWTGNSCAVKYRLQYRKQGITAWTTVLINAPIAFKHLTGLLSNSVYEIRMRTDCNNTGTVNSGWTTIQTFTTPLRLEEVSTSVFDLSVFPNPTDGNFILKVNSIADENAELTIVNILGQKVWSNPIVLKYSENIFNYSIENISSGIYFIELKTDEGVTTEKIYIAK